jgi:hypothetical protein
MKIINYHSKSWYETKRRAARRPLTLSCHPCLLNGLPIMMDYGSTAMNEPKN